MKSLTSWFARSTALLLGVGGMLVLAGCMERHPASPDLTGPLFAVWSGDEPCSATGSADTPVDGYIREDDWFNACTTSFLADRAGGSADTRVTARFMNDEGNAYFSALSDAPFSNPNSVLRIYLQNGTTTRVIGVAAGVAAEFDCNSSGCSFTSSVPAGASGARQNQSGGTGYELAWPLSDLGLTAGSVVDVRWETVPGGDADPTLYPAAGDDPLKLKISGGTVVDDNDPTKPDIIITTNYPVTVTIRDPDRDPLLFPDAFQCMIAQYDGEGNYVAAFIDLEAGTRYVGTAGNKKTCNHQIWPPLDPGYTPDYNIPGKEGALYNEGADPAVQPLTWFYWLDAAENAIPLGVIDEVGEIRELYIPLGEYGRTATCTVYGDGTTAWVVAPGDLTDPRVQALSSPSEPPVGLPPTYGKVENHTCTLTGLSDEDVVVQTRNSDGGESTGLLCADCETVTLFQQSNLQGSTFLIDDRGDGSPVDLLSMIFGPVKNSLGVLTGDFSILATFDGWNERKKEALVDFEIILDGGLPSEQTIRATATYLEKATRNKAAGWSVDASPDNQKARVKLGYAEFNMTTKQGGVEILIEDWTGVTTAEIRVMANRSGGEQDFMPNSGYATWPDGNGGSFNVRF
jgi:hypothetical protein